VYVFGGKREITVQTSVIAPLHRNGEDKIRISSSHDSRIAIVNFAKAVDLTSATIPIMRENLNL
jgi:hypothetical protein